MEEEEALCLSGDEFEDEMRMKRAAELGYKPQKELELNWLLPYSSLLDEESKQMFEEIKSHLGRAVMLREMKPACGVWTSRLMKYIRLYGLKFSKEDHIALIKLIYELMLIPELEPTKMHKFATLFIMLTKRRYLISPEELTLAWRPLYDLLVKLSDKSTVQIGMVHFMRSVEVTYDEVIKCAQPYFEPGATMEILAEILPTIVPWDHSCNLARLVLFLPVALRTEHAESGYKLWLDDMLTLWNTCTNSIIVGDLLSLFSGLAKFSPGAVDWSPHVPLMFTRFMHCFNLPVSYKNSQPLQSHRLGVKYMATWIVWGISHDGVMLHHLKSCLAGAESYLNSANTGRWSVRLKDFLLQLAREFHFRVYRERNPKFQKYWVNRSPQSFRLRDKDIDEFVQILLEPAILAINSPYHGIDSGYTLHWLATLRPAVVIPPLLNRFYSALESLTEPNRVMVAIQAICVVARPLVRGAVAGYPEGPTHVVPILIASLTGLDSNFIKKTLITLSLITIYGAIVPFVDCSDASDYYTDLTEEESTICAATSQIEAFVLMFFDKVFTIIESTSVEFIRMETRDAESSRTKTDLALESSISSAATVVLLQSSPKIVVSALRKFKAFATGATFEVQVSARHIGSLIRAFLRANAKATQSLFIPYICDKLNDLLSTDEAICDENPPRELLYHLFLLSHIVGENSNIADYFPILLPTLDRAMKTRARKAYFLACDTLSRLMGTFALTYIKDLKSCPFDYSEAPQKWLPIRHWGSGYALRETKFEWHVPSENDANVIEDLLRRYTLPEMERLKAWLNGEEIDKETRLRALKIINSSLSCIILMPPREEMPVQLVESALPATPFHLSDRLFHNLRISGVDLRQAVGDLCHDVQRKLVAEKSDDTKSLGSIVLIWECLCLEGRSWKGAAGLCVGAEHIGLGSYSHLRMLSSMERYLDARGGPKKGGARLRLIMSDNVKLQQQLRIDMRGDVGLGETHLKIINALLELSIYAYAEVRIRAQLRLHWMMTRHAYSYRAILTRLCELLKSPPASLSEEEAHARHKGTLYLLCGVRNMPLAAKQDWEHVRALWPAVLRAPLSEKLSIIRLEQGFNEAVVSNFPTVNTRLEMTADCVEAAKAIVPKRDLEDETFQLLLEKAVATEKALSDETERLYLELIEDLVSIVEDPSTTWRRSLVALILITVSANPQTDYPLSAVRAIVQSLNNDNIKVRTLAVKLTLFALKQSKQKHKKIKVDPFEVAGVARPEKIIPGYRDDNKWVMYSKECIPKTDAEWDRPYLHGRMGFYTWPDKIEVYAPSSEQPSPERSVDKMTECQREIYNFFNDDDNVEKLVGFLSAEDKKGKDKFNGNRFSMFKSLFRAYGLVITRKFLAHALKHAGNAHEASQRFAAEIASAALRGTKHWTRSNAFSVYDEIIKIYRTGLYAVTAESSEDWGTCLATSAENLEPHRAAPVLQAWMEMCIPEPASGEDADAESSFGISSRLFALQGAISALSWRGAGLGAEFVHRLQDARYIQHPYQIVRERVGSILMTTFDLDLVFPGGQSGPAPKYSDFLAETWPKLAALYDKHGEIIVQTQVAWAAAATRCDATATLAVPQPALSGRETLPEVVVAGSAQLGEVGETSGNSRPDTEEGEAGVVVAAKAHVEGELAERLDEGLRMCSGGEDVGATQHHQNEHARAINLLTTLLRGTVGSIVRGTRGVCVSHYELLHASCALSARGQPQSHDELARAADAYLASMAVANHNEALFDIALTQVERVCRSRSWWARLSAVAFSSALVFYCLPLLKAKPERAARVQALALDNMKDPRLEVRTTSAKLLTGLMHCGALPDETLTLDRLIGCCQSFELIERHCGVLGLCAYVSSRPYTIPPHLGKILAELLRHTNAPDPMPATIRKALADFKRTHQDDWQKHRETMSQDELDLLLDLAAPPAYCA